LIFLADRLPNLQDTLYFVNIFSASWQSISPRLAIIS
jgi:hypothetical protein